MTIKLNDRVKEIRTNKIGLVTEINMANTNRTNTRYLLDFPDNSFGWFGAKEIKVWHYSKDEELMTINK